MKQKIRKIIAKVLSFVLVMSFCLGTDLGVMTAYATGYRDNAWYITTDENGVLQKVQFKFATTDTAPGTWYFYLWDKNDTSGANGRPAILAQTSVTTSDGNHEITLEYQGEKGKEYLVGMVLKDSKWSTQNTDGAQYSKWPYLTAVCDMMDCDQNQLAGSVYVNDERIDGSVSDALKTEIQTYNITLDRTNYAEGYVNLYTYDGAGSNVANTQENNAAIAMPEGGKVRVFADSEFTVTAEGATISEMLSAGEEGYYYELTGITADTTVVVNKVTTQEQTYELTIDSTGFNHESGLMYILFEPGENGKMIGSGELGSKIEGIPHDAIVTIVAFTSDFEVIVPAEVGDRSELITQDGGMYSYNITGVKGTGSIVIRETTAADTATVTFVKSDFTGILGYSDGTTAPNVVPEGLEIEIQKGKTLTVVSDSNFTLTLSDSTLSATPYGDGYFMCEVGVIQGDVTITIAPATDTYELTIDCAGFSEDAPLAVIRFDSEGYDIDAIEVANGDKVEIPVGGSVIVASTTPNFKVAVENNLADVSDLQQGAAESGYVITNIQGDITIVIESITQGGDPTYNITLDRTNYAEGYVDLYTYDGAGSYVANAQENNAAIAMPEGGKVRVFADSEFTVIAEGATISEMLSAGEERYYYELTGIAADITVVVSPSQSEPVITAPIITIQPENKTAEEGNTTTFSVTATGDDLTYQWQIDRNDGNGFVNLTGATSTSYTTSAVDMDCDGFKYQCIVTNEGGSVTSNTATLTVTEKPEEHIHAISQEPAKAATCTEEGNKVYYTCLGCDSLFEDENATITTTAEAVKIAALGHDWTGEWTVVKEATATEAGKKETLCTRGCGEKKEEVIPVIEIEPVEAPVITTQPENKTVEDGNTATFSVTATGEDLTYQWQIDRNDGKGFVSLNGATSASYTTSTVDMDCDGFKYQCIVTNEGGSVTSDIATLTVTEKPSVHTHSLTQVPAKAATCTEEGNTVYYTCSGCDSLFADANGTTTTTAEAVKVAVFEHDWTGEWTVIKEATATEDGKKETLCTRGCGQKKVEIIPATGTTDDNGNLEKDAEVEPEAPIDEVTLNNSKEELLDAGNIFTDAEKTQIEDGADARIWLEISKTDESAIASTDKAKIEQEAAKIMGNNQTITYFDVDLFKQVGSGAKQEITEPGIAMKITIVIPDELLNTDKKVSREYKIIRLHEGQVDVINGTFDSTTGEFTFETDKFSTYAIVYKDVPVNDNDDNSTPGDTDVIKPEDDKKDEVPKTGDSNTTLYSFILMLLSGLGIIICSGKKKLLNKES